MTGSKEIQLTSCTERQDKECFALFVRWLGKEGALRALGEGGFVRNVVHLTLSPGWRKTKGSIDDENIR